MSKDKKKIEDNQYWINYYHLLLNGFLQHKNHKEVNKNLISNDWNL